MPIMVSFDADDVAGLIDEISKFLLHHDMKIVNVHADEEQGNQTPEPAPAPAQEKRGRGRPPKNAEAKADMKPADTKKTSAPADTADPGAPDTGGLGTPEELYDETVTRLMKLWSEGRKEIVKEVLDTFGVAKFKDIPKDRGLELYQTANKIIVSVKHAK